MLIFMHGVPRWQFSSTHFSHKSAARGVDYVKEEQIVIFLGISELQKPCTIKELSILDT
jgi:hypothetical protein